MSVNQNLSNKRYEWGLNVDDRHVKDPQRMRSLADQAARELEGASAEDIIRWATDTFGVIRGGTHAGYRGSLPELVSDAGRLCNKIAQL